MPAHPPPDRDHRAGAHRPLVLAGWALALAPACILLHELGHLAAAHAVGYPTPVLHYAGVDPGPDPGVSAAATGLVALAGPVVSATLAVAGCAWMRWRGAGSIAAALAIAGASRFVVAVPYTIAALGGSVVGARLAAPEFDEYEAGVGLGVSGDAVLASTALLLALVVWWVTRHLPRGARGRAWAGLLLGTGGGWALWLQGLGPRLLP